MSVCPDFRRIDRSFQTATRAKPAWPGAGVASDASSAARRGRFAWPAGCARLAEPGPEPVDLRLDLRGRLLVALAVRRDVVEAHRLAEDDADRLELPRPPAERAADRRRDDGDTLLERHHRGARHRGARHAGALARPLDEDPERLAAADDLAHRAHRVAVGR